MKLMKFLLRIVLGAVSILIVLVLVGAVSVFLLNQTNGSIVSSGTKREYLLYVPKSYDPAKPVPLIISLHPAMTWPAFQMNLTGWNKAADENGFIVVYPAGTGSGLKSWFMEGADDPGKMPDVRFISELIDSLQTTYNIDSSRIYVNGISNGGGMAFVLSCALSNRIAAIGAVAAAQSLPWTWCKDERPVPMIAFHGTADPIVPYNGGKVTIAPRPFPSVRSWAANWAHRNRCDPDPAESAAVQGVLRIEYKNCAENAPVVLYAVDGAGHQWFGGKAIAEWMVGPMSNRIDATRVMLAFFRDHPLQKKPPN